MEIKEINSPLKLMNYMDEHIQFGFYDQEGQVHTNMNEFHEYYRLTSIYQTLVSGVGSCIEQTMLEHYLLNRMHIPSRMYFFEYDSSPVSSREHHHLHAFLLYYLGGKVFYLEHALERIRGIYAFPGEEEAISYIVEQHRMRHAVINKRIVEFPELKPGLSTTDIEEMIHEKVKMR